MATCSIWKVSDRLDKVIKYAVDSEKTLKEDKDILENYYSLHRVLNYAKADYKTEKQCYVSGINCEPEFALMQMRKVKKLFKKEDGIIAFHGYQSFKEGEVTPEEAHKIGIQLAEELWGDRFQVVVSTHLNTNHIHNHLVLNSVSFIDGKKFYNNRYTYGLMRHLNDEICKEYNLSYLEEKKCKKSKINFGNYYLKYEQKNNYSVSTKKDVDFAIRQARTYKEFLNIMKKLNYVVVNRYEKLSVRREPYKRNIRIERQFGEEYTIKRIKQRILEEQNIQIPFYVSRNGKRYIPKLKVNKNRKMKVTGFMAIYFHYKYLFNKYQKKPEKTIITENVKKSLNKMNIYSDQIKFIAKNKLNTNVDLINYISDKNNKLRVLIRKREKLWYQSKKIVDEKYKEKVEHDIKELNKQIKELRKEVKTGEEIKFNIIQMKENIKEQKEFEEREKQKKIEKEKMKWR